jgi:transcriptional regulator with XRE-family HTH domain
MAREKKFHTGTPLGRWREKNNLSQHQVADMLGISQSHACNIEQGRFKVTGPLEKLIDRIIDNDDAPKTESTAAL